MEFELTQFSDTASYSRTISAVLAADPSAVLVSRSARGTQLVQLLEQALGSRLTFLERRHFDEAEGQNLLEEAIVVGLQQADFASKFAAAASFTALWRYIESSSDVRLVTSSCRVTFRVACDVCMIDSSTARLLELVTTSKSCAKSVLSLFKTTTSQGTQLLRQAILQPCAKLSEIQKRHSAVEVLLEGELLERVQQLLPGVGDLDLLVARLTTEPRQRGMPWYKVAVRTALRLRQALSALPHLADALRIQADGRPSQILELCDVLSHPSFNEQLQELDRVLDNTPPGRGSMAHAAVMYAVKPNVNALLDVARQRMVDGRRGTKPWSKFTRCMRS